MPSEPERIPEARLREAVDNWEMMEQDCEGLEIKDAADFAARLQFVERSLDDALDALGEALQLFQGLEWKIAETHLKRGFMRICPQCEQDDEKGHFPDCPLAAIIRRIEELVG